MLCAIAGECDLGELGSLICDVWAVSISYDIYIYIGIWCWFKKPCVANSSYFFSISFVFHLIPLRTGGKLW